MYCKYCGCAAGNVTECPGCGAKIDIRDGGQSFFEDEEIEEWRVMPEAGDIPKTEIREAPAPGQKLRAASAAYPAPVRKDRGAGKVRRSGGKGRGARTDITDTEEPSLRRRRKQEKKAEKGLKKKLLMRPDLLIALCIVTALILVLAIVWTASFFTSGTDGEADVSEPAVTVQAAPDESADGGGSADTDDAVYIEELENCEYLPDSRFVGHDGKEIETENRMYRIDGMLYVPLDDIMEILGFEVTAADEGHAAFVRGEKRIDVIKGTPDITLTTESGARRESLEMNTYNVSETKHITYVPAKYFFAAVNIGYSSTAEGDVIFRDSAEDVAEEMMR